MFLKMVRGEAGLTSPRFGERHRGSSAESYEFPGGDGDQPFIERVISNVIIALAILFVSFFFTLSILDFLL